MPVTFVGLVTLCRHHSFFFLSPRKEEKAPLPSFSVSMNRRSHMREKKNQIGLASNNRRLMVVTNIFLVIVYSVPKHMKDELRNRNDNE
jgi:hypothetical protein